MTFREDSLKSDFYNLLRKLKRRVCFADFEILTFPIPKGHLRRPQVLQYMLHASLQHLMLYA